MANVSKWAKVAVDVESTAAAPVAIVGISKDSPGVVTFHGTLPDNGAYVRINSNGMSQVDGRVFRVANGASGSPDSFELEGEDTTDFDAFVSGEFEVVTFGLTMTTARGLQASGGDFDFIDITTIHDNIRRQVPGAASPATYQFENIWDIADAALVGLKQASDNQDLRAVRFTFANGQRVVFNGYVGATLLPVGQAQDLVTTSVVVTMFGRPTVYAS
jgi:hypothetical protein